MQQIHRQKWIWPMICVRKYLLPLSSSVEVFRWQYWIWHNGGNVSELFTFFLLASNKSSIIGNELRFRWVEGSSPGTITTFSSFRCTVLTVLRKTFVSIVFELRLSFLSTNIYVEISHKSYNSWYKCFFKQQRFIYVPDEMDGLELSSAKNATYMI